MRHAAAGRTRAVYARGWPAVMHMPPLPPPLPPGWKCKCVAEVTQQRHQRLDPMRRQCITSHPPAAAKTAPHPVSRYLAVLSGGVALYLLSCHHAHRCRPTRRSHPKRQPHRKRAGQTPFPLSLSVSHAGINTSNLLRCGSAPQHRASVACTSPACWAGRPRARARSSDSRRSTSASRAAWRRMAKPWSERASS